jgi:uncharacterized protein YdbL (DUF1318 family)
MRWKLPLAILGALALVACITINVYFPEAAIKDLSEQIEEQVEREAAGQEAPPPGQAGTGTSPQARRQGAAGEIVLALLSFGARPAWAEDEVPAPGITNPAIRQIIASRATRLEALNRFKAAGVIGESNVALVEVRDLDAVGNLRERAEVQRLVKDENADREQLFREIAAAESVDLSQLPRIQQTYAETLREKARAGDWIQLEDGSWVQKE